jgi:hypothetical protein
MLPKRAYIISGFAYLLMALILIMNSFQGLTGYVVLEGADVDFSGIAGAWFILAGLLAFVLMKKK